MGEGELFRTGGNEVDVGTFLQNQAGGLDGIPNALDAGHAAGFHAASIHEQGVKLDTAVGGKKAAAAGVEGGVVFENGYGCLHGIECGAAARKEMVAGLEGMEHASLMRGRSILGNGPCATVDEKRGNVGGGGHPDMVVHPARHEARMRRHCRRIREKMRRGTQLSKNSQGTPHASD